MSLMMFCLLEAIKRIGNSASTAELADVAGYMKTSIGGAIRAAKDLDWIESRSGVFWLTERGKIALAIAHGRQRHASARGIKFRWIPHNDFLEMNCYAERRKQKGRAQRERQAARWAGDAERGDARGSEGGGAAE